MNIVDEEIGQFLEQEGVAQVFCLSGNTIEGAGRANVLEARSNDTQRQTALATETAGNGAGLVVQVVDDLPDTIAGLHGHIGPVVQHPRYRLM